MKTYAIPADLLGAAAALIKRLPAQDDVVAVLNGLNNCVAQQNQNEQAAERASRASAAQGGGGPGEEK